MVANTIEAFKNIKDINSVDTLEPFLSSGNARIKANAIVTLHNFEEFERRPELALRR